jgi:5,10-methylenetetrahydromethanopterin reductase
MPLTFEAEISPGMAAADVVALARMAEDVGFDRLGISDVVLWQDCFVLLGLVARETSRILLGPMVTNPYTRHPAVLASLAATLHDVSNGRFFLGIGAGAGLEPLGGGSPRLVTSLRECVTAIRGLLQGGTVDYTGETVSLHGARLRHGPAKVPISIGTRSPQVMRLAGEIADIALVGGHYLSPSLAADYRTWIAKGAARAGRPISTVEIAPRITLCTSVDGALARRSVKRYVAHYAALIRPAELGLDDDWYRRIEAALARSTGWYFDHDRHDDPEIYSLVSDSLVRAFAIAGTPKECREMAEEIIDMGFTSLSMNLSFAVGAGMRRGLAETIAGFGSVLGDLRTGYD